LLPRGGDEEDLGRWLGLRHAGGFGRRDETPGDGRGDLLEGERMTDEVFGEAFAAGVVVGGHGLFAAVVDGEAGVFPSEEAGELFRADNSSGSGG